MLTKHAVRIRRPIILLVAMAVICQICLAQQAPSDTQARRVALESERMAAIRDVQRIVNQPVRKLVRTEDMRVSTFSPGWFHEGAMKPDFDNVDVRTTRETPYDKYQYVTSDLNPGFVFIGSDLEFNANTKAFYTDRSVPKKKLSEIEMIEINRLYRIIGRCEQALAKLK